MKGIPHMAKVLLRLFTEYTEVHGMDIRTQRLLRDALRYFMPRSANEFNSAFSSGRWDGYKYLFDTTLCRFPTGLCQRVVSILKREGIEYEIDKRLPQPSEKVSREVAHLDTLRPYQEEAVSAALKYRRGLIRIPTGGGKTVVAEHLIHRSSSPRCVFIVPNRVLLNQTYRRFKAAFPGTDICKWGDGSKDRLPVGASNYILVSTVQSAWLDKAGPLLRDATMVIVDECHHQAATTFHETTRMCNQASTLIGLSATPFRDDGADMEMEAWLGPVIYEVSYDTLIDNGYLVPPEFHKVHTLEQAYEKTKGLKTLIFSEKVQDLENVRDTLTLHNTPILTGKSRTTDIRARLDELRSGHISHIAATPIFDEGLDIPDLDAVIFYATGRSKVRTLQRIGRVMRPAPGKEKCIVVDLHDKAYRDRYMAYHTIPAFSRRLK